MNSTKTPFGSIDPTISAGNGKNKDAVTMMTAIEVSKRSGVPVLFMGNPGCGKTSAIEAWAKGAGYHVETLIGSHFGRDDVLGYQVNETGAKSLVVKDPEWFANILDFEEKGQPSVLFIDEISGAPEETQNSLYELIFEKKARGNRYLPKSTIIVSAANYHQNLPTWCNITSPALNRFAIINMLPGTADSDPYSIGLEMVNECLQDFKCPPLVSPTFNDNSFDDATSKQFLDTIKNNFSALFKKHAGGKDSSAGVLDMRNVKYDGMYDREDGIPEVYNFISKRTISYYARVMKALAEMGCDGNNPIYQKFTDGLIGIGTNNWTQDSFEAFKAQLDKYHQETYTMTASLLNRFSKIKGKNVAATTSKPKASSLQTFDTKTIAGKINTFLSDSSNADDSKFSSKEFTSLCKEIWSAYEPNESKVVGNVQKVLTSSKDTGVLQFRADYEAIQLMISSLKNSEKVTSGLKAYRQNFDKIIDAYSYYYVASAMDIESDQI